MKDTIINSLKEKYLTLHGDAPQLIVRAPGRINLIGEHTDYNDGFVFPAAIDKAIYFAAGRRNDDTISFFANDLNDSFTSDIYEFERTRKQWPNYLLGVIDVLQKDGFELGGLNIVFGGNIPLGAGLSSSAAVETGMLYVLNQLFSLKIDKIRLIKYAQQAENQFVGIQCGIMDMFASVMGKADAAIRLDCRDLSYEYFPFSFPDHELLIINTGVKHALVTSEYNTRRQECETGVALMMSIFPSIKSLRDVNSSMVLEAFEKGIFVDNQTIYSRCRYVCAENERVEQASLMLQNADLEAFGTLMYASHEGLQYLYEVSCDELDYLVDVTRKYNQKKPQSIVGARMMGGGFGGCTLNLVRREEVERFIQFTSNLYFDAYQKVPETYHVSLCDGVGKL